VKELSDREKAILKEMVEGATNVEISARLYLAVSTVKNYVMNICVKLGARNRTHAAVIAVREELV
jgi:two-component system response regulator DesR